MHDPHFQRLVMARLDEISERSLRRFAALEYKLDQLLKGAITMSIALADLTAAVNKSTTVEQSAITMIQGLAAQIAANATDPAAVSALASQLNAGADALAAAITANTPAAPAPAPSADPTPATP